MGHEDISRHKKERASSVDSSPPREGEPVGTQNDRMADCLAVDEAYMAVF